MEKYASKTRGSNTDDKKRWVAWKWKGSKKKGLEGRLGSRS